MAGKIKLTHADLESCLKENMPVSEIAEKYDMHIISVKARIHDYKKQHQTQWGETSEFVLQKKLVTYETKGIELPPEQKRFDLRVGDIISAVDIRADGHRRKYRVVDISRRVYTCERIEGNGKGIQVDFIKHDYRRASDTGKVKFVERGGNIGNTKTNISYRNDCFA